LKGIADTGFLVAFANANDKHHLWAAQLAAGVTEPLLTCEAVIAETAFYLESSAVALAMINEGLVALAFDCRERFQVYRRNKREAIPLLCPPGR
jgi:predicted nucleic acid-binding protein